MFYSSAGVHGELSQCAIVKSAIYDKATNHGHIPYRIQDETILCPRSPDQLQGSIDANIATDRSVLVNFHH